MKICRLTIKLVLYAFCVMNVFCNKQDNIAELLSGCSLEKKLNGMSVYLEDSVTIADVSLDDEKKAMMSELILANFQSGTLMMEIKKRLEDNYNDNYVKELVQFFKTEPTVKITRMETAAFKPLFLLSVQNLNLKKLTDNRKILINQIMQSTKIMEVIKLMLMEILQGTISGITQLTGKEIDTPEYKEREKSLLDNISSEENYSLVFQIYAACYAVANDRELEQYNRHLLTEHGQWFINQITEGIRQGTMKCMLKAVADFIKISGTI